MEMTGQYLIEAPREKVWEALNDPEILRATIPGCESLEQNQANSFDAKVKAKVGPISAKFSGSVTLSEINPPESYTISGSGKGAAGGASGGAKVRLDEEGGATRLSYEVEAKVNGKLAQLGGRLIDSAAKKMANDFFGAFAEKVGGSPDAPASAPAPDTAASPTTASPTTASGDPSVEDQATRAALSAVAESRQKKSLSPAAWIAGLIAIVAILLVIFGYAS